MYTSKLLGTKCLSQVLFSKFTVNFDETLKYYYTTRFLGLCSARFGRNPVKNRK